MPAVFTSSTLPPPAIHKRVDAADVREQLTDKYSTRNFAIEYDGYLSNHLLHGVVALFELGATKQQIERYADHYAKEKLVAVAPDHEDPYEVVVGAGATSNSTDDVAVPSPERVKQLLGRREDFDALVAFYGHDIKLLGADATVQKHLPGLVDGLCGALLHGLIQLGYAHHIGGDRLVAEGLAYFHFSYLSFADHHEEQKREQHIEKKQFTRDEAMRLAHALKNHEFILSEMHSQLATRAFDDLPLGIYQRKLNALSAHPERGNAAAFQFISSTLDQYNLTDLNGDFALDFSLWLYAMVEHNDFVLAHAVTSAWSLKQLEHLLKPADLARAWRVWLHVAISAFIIQEVADLRTHDICNRALLELPALESWEGIVSRFLGLDGYPDEHVYKVVQVAHEHAATENASKSSGFLTSEEREFVARKAAIKVIAMDF